MAKCTQCDREAFYVINDHPLCVEHAASVQAQQGDQLRHLAMMYNLALDEMDAVVGMPGLSPRMKIPPPKTEIVHRGDMKTFNNITIDRSIVGAVNTGSVDSIEVSLDRINNGGGTEIARAIAEFTEIILGNSELTSDQRAKIVELIETLSEQFSLPANQRKRHVLSMVWGAITTEAGNFTKLAAACEKLSSILGIDF